MTGSDKDHAGRAQRLAAFFRGFGFTDPARISRLIDGLAIDPAATPEQAAEGAEQQVSAWFRAVLGAHAAPAWQTVALGRAAFLRADGARRWPDAFLAAGEPPAELVAALRRDMPVAVPEPVPAVMTAQSLEWVSLTALVRPWSGGWSRSPSRRPCRGGSEPGNPKRIHRHPSPSSCDGDGADALTTGMAPRRSLPKPRRYRGTSGTGGPRYAPDTALPASPDGAAGNRPLRQRRIFPESIKIFRLRSASHNRNNHFSNLVILSPTSDWPQKMIFRGSVID